MEAIDQPWKEGLNGDRAEAYWGVFNASRQPKFAFTGTVIEDPIWPWKAGLASLIALLPMFWFARHFIRFRAAGLVFFLVLDPAVGIDPRVDGHAALRLLSRPARLDHARAAVPGPARDHRDPADQRLRVHRSAVAAALAARVPAADARARRSAAVRVDPSGLLQRAARDGDPDSRFARRARLRQLRSPRDRQQHEERGRVAARSRRTARSSARASASSTSSRGPGSRPAHSISASPRPTRAPRWSPWSTPTTRCAATGCAR